MKAIIHYEVCIVNLGRWALHSRLTQGEESCAIEVAHGLEADSGWSTQFLEESPKPGAGRLIICVAAKKRHRATGGQGPFNRYRHRIAEAAEPPAIHSKCF